MIPLKKSRSIMTITIYHNPRCGTSRNALALIRNSGAEPTIIEYLLDPPGREQLQSLIRQAGLTVRQALRDKEALCAELGLLRDDITEDRLLDAMLAHPVLINRPFVVTERGVRLCRPSEVVLDILPAPQKGPFSKEDGEPVIDQDGNRVR